MLRTLFPSSVSLGCSEEIPVGRKVVLLPGGCSSCEAKAPQAGGKENSWSRHCPEPLGLQLGPTAPERREVYKPDRSPSCTNSLSPFCHPRDSNKDLIKGFTQLLDGRRGIKGNWGWMVKGKQHPMPELHGGGLVSSEDALRRGGEALSNRGHPPLVETLPGAQLWGTVPIVQRTTYTFVCDNLVWAGKAPDFKAKTA